MEEEMSVNPVLSILQEEFPSMAINQDGNSSRVLGKKDLRNVVYTITIAYDPDARLWKIRGSVRIRYKLNARVRLYARALQRELSAADIMVELQEPCSIILARGYAGELFSESEPVEIAEALYGELGGLSHLMMSVSRLAQLSYRLSGRPGTHAYRVVLPSQLAKLTVCGFDQQLS
jgi:hypothetical protein